MNKIIQLVGIPASGKSYLLGLCSERDIFGGLNYIEFGNELKDLLVKAQNREEPDVERAVRDLIDDIVKDRQPAIFTSHAVFYNDRGFTYNADLELYTRSAGYVHLYSDPETILNRRIKDEKMGVKFRNMEDLEFIAMHQRVSLQVVQDMANQIGANFMSIENESGYEETNLAKIRDFVEV